MANDVKDIALNLRVQSSGTEQVTALVQQMEALAKEGGAAAPEFARFAEEFRKIGAQQAAVQSMAALEAEVERLSAAFEQARVQALDLSGTLTMQREQVDAARVAQTGAREALAATRQALRDNQQAQDALKDSSDKATRQTTEYKESMQRLALEMGTLKNAQGAQNDALKESSRILVEAEKGLRGTASAYDAAQREAGQFSSELKQQEAAFRTVSNAAQQLGVSTNEVAAAQAEVENAFERTRAAAQQEEQAYQQLRAVQEAVAQGNAAAVASAREAAAEREAAAVKVAAAEREQQRATEATALSAKLAAQQQEAAARDVVAAAEQEAAAARQAQEAMQQAFGVLGVRSAQQITAEIQRVNAALETVRTTAGVSGAGLSAAMNAGQAKIRDLERELRAANGQITLMDRLSNGLKTSMGAFAGGNLLANAAQAIAGAVQQMGREAVVANVELQKLELGLNAVYGSSKVTAAQIEFLRNTAQTAGVSVGDISGAFVKFAASANSAGIPIGQVNGLFAALSKNAAQLGLSGDKVADMLNALGQMASKGAVQMEELRGQLADALPGALPKVAAGLGITVAEMEKLSRNGELLASEVFPALQKVLEQGGGEVETLSARWARFKNEMTETAQIVGQGAIGEALSKSLAGAQYVVERLAFGVAMLGEGFTVVGKRIGIAMADIADQGLKFRGFSDSAKEAFEEVDQAATEHLAALASRIQGETSAVSENFDKMGKSAEHAGQKIVFEGDRIVYVTDRVAQSTTAAAAAAQGGVTSWTQLVVAYGKVNDVLNQQVTVAKAHLEAKKAEGAAMQEVARLSGDEAAQRKASAAAANENAIAQAAMTAALSQQLDVLRAQRDAELALYNASSDRQEAQRLAIEELNKGIQVKAQELQKSKEITESLRTEAIERKTAIETLKDNSARVGELQAAYANARIEVERMQHLQKEGKATTEQVTDATRAAAQAERLYADALSDKIAKMNEASRAQQAGFSLQEATLRLAIEEAKTTEEVAKARGDEKSAAEAGNRVKQLEIELLRLQAQAQRAEAEAILAALPAKRAQLALENKLTEAMKLQLEAEELSARSKLKQAEITDELAERASRVASATRAAAQAASDSAAGYDAMGDAMGRAAGSADRLGSSLRNARAASNLGPGEAPVMGADGRPVPGFVQKTQIGMESDAIATLRQKRDMGLLSQSDRAAAEAAYMAETANAATFSGMNSAFVSQQAITQSANRARDAKAILDQIRAMENQAGATTAAAAGAAGAPAAAAPAAQGTVHKVQIQLGGATTTIQTASAADANNLAGLLKQLGDASQRTNV